MPRKTTAKAKTAPATPPRAGHRMSSLTPPVYEAFVSAARAGVPIKWAARTAGVSNKTYHRWRMLAREEPKKYPRLVAFFADVARAEAERYREAIDAIRMAGNGYMALEEEEEPVSVEQAERLGVVPGTTVLARRKRRFTIDWRAAAKYLSAKDPAVWSDKMKVEQSGKVEARLSGKLLVVRNDDELTLLNEAMERI